MPYTDTERHLLATLIKKHGAKKGTSIFYGMLNSRKHEAVFGSQMKEERARKQSH